jgi:hypothetical protein
MRGNIEQNVALTLWGNAFIQGFDTRQFWQFAAGFEVCPNIRFDTGSRTPAPVGPAQWLDRLKQMHADLRLRAPADSARNVTALDDGPGATFLIEAASPSGRSLWQATWTQHKSSWAAAYKPQPLNAASFKPAMDLDDLCNRLSRELGTVASFTARHIPAWERTFRDAERILDRGLPSDAGGSEKLYPPGFLNETARRLLGACCTAWIFGGMGNFADNSYGSLDSQVSTYCNTLFETYEQVLLAVTNSTCHGAQQS